MIHYCSMIEKNNDPEAHYKLGNLYMNGKGKIYIFLFLLLVFYANDNESR